MITKHAKKRMVQRFAVTRKKSQKDLFDIALHNGQSPGYYRDCPFKDYLLKLDKKQRYTQVKVYDQKIFIHRNKSLITAFNIPKKFGDTDKYLAYNRIEYKLRKKVEKKYHTDLIVFKDVSRYFKKDLDDLFVVSIYIKGKLINYGIGKSIAIARIDGLNNIINEEGRILVR